MMETTSDLKSFNFTLSLIMADAARLSFVFTNVVTLPYCVKVLESVHLFKFLPVQRDGGFRLLGAAIHCDFAFLRAYFYSVCSLCFVQSVGETLNICFAASHEVNVICNA